MVGKVEEMKQQRAMLATQLRESTCQDDITRQLVTRTGESLDAIFNQEMQKHQRYVSTISGLLFDKALSVKCVMSVQNGLGLRAQTPFEVTVTGGRWEWFSTASGSCHNFQFTQHVLLSVKKVI